MYIINGRNGYQNKNMIILDLSTNLFVDNGGYNDALPTYTISPCVSNDGLKIYVTGGFDVVYYTQTLIYDISGDSWSMGAEFVNARAFHGCAMNNDKTELFVFGGWNGNILTRLNSVERYVIANDTWTELNAQLNEPLSGIVRCINNEFSEYTDYILCIGGGDGSSYQQTINIFDPNTLKMHIPVLNGLATAVAAAPTVIYSIPNNNAHLLLLFGGDTSSCCVETFSTRIQYLTLIEPPPTFEPTKDPTVIPSGDPTMGPTNDPTNDPTAEPTAIQP